MGPATANRRVLLACVKLALCLALLCAPARGSAEVSAPLAAPPITFKTVITKGWKADLPDTWKREERGASGRDGSRGLWTYSSESRNFSFRVRIRKERGEDFKKAAEANLARMVARMDNPQVLTNTITAEGANKLALFLISGGMRRNKTIQPYFVFRMLAQGVSGPPARVTVTLSGTNERLDTFMSIYDRAFKTFEMQTATQKKN